MAARNSSKLALQERVLEGGLARGKDQILGAELLENTADRFDREPESVIRQLPGEQFLKVLL